MPKKPAANKLAPFSIRFTPEIKALLQALADSENRSMSNYLETRLPVWLAADDAQKKSQRK